MADQKLAARAAAVLGSGVTVIDAFPVYKGPLMGTEAFGFAAVMLASLALFPHGELAARLVFGGVCIALLGICFNVARSWCTVVVTPDGIRLLENVRGLWRRPRRELSTPTDVGRPAPTLGTDDGKTVRFTEGSYKVPMKFRDDARRTLRSP